MYSYKMTRFGERNKRSSTYNSSNNGRKSKSRSMILVVVAVHGRILLIVCGIILVLSALPQQQQQHQYWYKFFISPSFYKLDLLSTSGNTNNTSNTTDISNKFAYSTSSAIFSASICLHHEPIYLPHIIRNPRKYKKMQLQRPQIRLFQTNMNSTNTSNKIEDQNDNGEYLIQPTPRICGRLRNTFWKNGGYSVMSKLAQQIENQQTNCSLPKQYYVIGDNQYTTGLGAQLHLWSQEIYCHSGISNRVPTDNDSRRQQNYRIETIIQDSYTTSNRSDYLQPIPSLHWIWADRTYCPSLSRKMPSSPFACYFPKMEQRCPDNDHIASFQHQQILEKHSNKQPCSLIVQQSLTHSTTSGAYTISEYRAAATEFIFQSINPIIVQEAERQIGLLFVNNDTASRTQTHNKPSEFTATPNDLITVHIRWGDKFFEMDLVSIPEYCTAISNMLLNFMNHTTDQYANIYVLTEDPNAVHELEQYTRSHYPHWNLYIDRTVTELQSFRPVNGNRASYMTHNTAGRSTLVSLGSLLVALESKYYILTTASNWSRIINELRINVLNRKCNDCTSMIDLRPGEW